MAIIVQTNESPSKIRVALIIENGKIKPVWFEEVAKRARDRIYVKEVASVWSHQEGTAKIVNFAVWDGINTYRLSLNTREFTWRLGIVEESPFPSSSTSSAWRFRRDG